MDGWLWLFVAVLTERTERKIWSKKLYKKNGSHYSFLWLADAWWLCLVVFCFSSSFVGLKKNVSLQKNSHGRRNVVRPSSSSSIHLSIYRKRRKLDSGIALGKQRRTKKITFAFLNMLHHHHRLSRDIFVRCWSSSLWAPGTHKISEKIRKN